MSEPYGQAERFAAGTPEESRGNAFVAGMRDAIPLLGGYIPVALSFGLIATQSGFGVLAAVLISAFVYAGASQFLFVAMVSAGAPLWTAVVMALIINARHSVYGPSIAPYIPDGRHWWWLMHGLTDQIFALAYVRLPQLPDSQRRAWFTGAMLLAWFSWLGGTAAGALIGHSLIERWPLLNDVMRFALPALFLVLLAPRLTSPRWTVVLLGTSALALGLSLTGHNQLAIPLAALAGLLLFYAINPDRSQHSER